MPPFDEREHVSEITALAIHHCRENSKTAPSKFGSAGQWAVITESVLGALRTLPVEQRMEMMGMVHVGWYGGQGDGSSPTYAEGLPANPSTERCQLCRGVGTYPDHDPMCPGGGPICEGGCPVEVLCIECRGAGVVPIGTSTVTQEAVDEPF